MNNKTTTKYAVYCRKSSEAEDRQVLSIPSQEKELNDVAKKNGLKIVKIYREEMSAHHPGRKYFNEMISELQKGTFSGILVWHANRLSRNAVDAGALIYAMDIGSLVNIKTTHGDFYNTPDNKFILGLEFGISKKDSDEKSVSVKRGLKAKAEVGWLPNGSPLGYINVGDQKGFKEMANDPDRFDAIRKTWDLMLAGNYTVKKIRHVLNEDLGFRTRQSKRQGGKKISMSMLYKIFSDPFYYGYFEYPKHSGNWYQGKHQPMVTEEEFNKVRVILGNKLKPAPHTKIFAYTGLMRCGHCKAQITAEEKYKHQKNGKVHHYIYYRCTKKKDLKCIEKYIEIKELEKQIDELLSQVEIDEDFKNWAIKYLKVLHKKEMNSIQTSISSKQKNYKSVLKKLDGLIQLKISGEDMLSDEEYRDQKTKLAKEKIELEEQMCGEGYNFDSVLEMSEKTFNFAQHARYWFENGNLQTKRDILSSLGSNLLIKDQKLTLDLHKPFLTLKNSLPAVIIENRRLEPVKNGSNKRQTSTFHAGFPSLLAWVDSFRNYDWRKALPCPDVTIKYVKYLLSLI